MYSRDKLYLHSHECYFCVYLNTKVTLLWALKQFVTRVHTLFYIYREHTVPYITLHKQTHTYASLCSKLPGLWPSSSWVVHAGQKTGIHAIENESVDILDQTLSHMPHCFEGVNRPLGDSSLVTNIHNPFMHCVTSQYLFKLRDIIMLLHGSMSLRNSACKTSQSYL